MSTRFPAPAPATAAPDAPALAPEPEDPHRWLEAVDAETALAWVRERNSETEAALQAAPGFDALRTRLREILDSPEQIPYVVRRGDWLYNYWRDAGHPRGLWRRTTLAQFHQATPEWQTVLDLDALATAEGENWVWGGAVVHAPAYRRALLQLSRGGADASLVREFDLVECRFVDDGFTLPEAKSSVDWDDEDHLFVGTDTGPGSLTASGYPRQIRRWRRGTPLAEAPVVFEGEPDDVYVSALVDDTPGFALRGFARRTDFYRDRVWLRSAGREGELLAVDKPEDALLHFWGRWWLIELRSDWTVAGRSWPGGALLAIEGAAYRAGARDFDAVFTPGPTCSLAGIATTRSSVLLTLLDRCTGRLQAWTPVDGRWQGRDLPTPPLGTLACIPLHDPLLDTPQQPDPLAEHFMLNYADFLTPDSLLLGSTDTAGLETLKARPRYFDSTGMRVEQHFATSRDGTQVPYFVVWGQGAKPGQGGPGDNPTLLYGYGGFEIALGPQYSGTVGHGWLARGGVYVQAGIRGGGEFGPAWHQAALKAHRQRAYDDFAAVAEDLIARGITRPGRLGIQGGSNGGLLVGAVMLQRPELFAAVVCQVPLLDMRRFHKLLAGASWMAEYGNPDDPADWDFIRRYSPYHNVPAAADKRLPAVLLTTSTRDDRVHPGHARKMAARLRECGHRVWYWENLEGGHAGAADNAQRAQMAALGQAFLWQQLGGAQPDAAAPTPST
jgi:prolyl oligopeptidase